MIKAAYSLIDRCYIHMDINGDKLSVQITSKGDIPEGKLKLKLDNEILAQTVRYHVYQQTHNNREIPDRGKGPGDEDTDGVMWKVD